MLLELREGRRQPGPAARSDQLPGHRAATKQPTTSAELKHIYDSTQDVDDQARDHRRLPHDRRQGGAHHARPSTERRRRSSSASRRSATSRTSRRRRNCGRSTRRKRTRTCACRWSASSARWARSISCTQIAQDREGPGGAPAGRAQPRQPEDREDGRDAGRDVRQRDRQGQQAWRSSPRSATRTTPTGLVAHRAQGDEGPRAEDARSSATRRRWRRTSKVAADYLIEVIK